MKMYILVAYGGKNVNANNYSIQYPFIANPFMSSLQNKAINSKKHPTVKRYCFFKFVWLLEDTSLQLVKSLVKQSNFLVVELELESLKPNKI